MASLPPDPPGAGSGATGADKGGLSTLNLGFLRGLTEKRATRDGQPAKRRGPKPDSKPALTRRQELNRQAQRTHRERKEHYIKALEDEVLRLKEVYSNVSNDKDKLAQENRQLKQILSQSGLAASSTGGGDDSRSAGYTSSGSVTGSGAPPGSRNALTPPLTSQSTAPSLTSQHHGHQHGHQQQFHSLSMGQQIPQQQQPPPQQHLGPSTGQQLRNITQQQTAQSRGLDYDQAGIDFVLTLEKPCMDHLPFLLERGASTGDACGHALMASCPPEPFSELTGDVPFGYTNVRPLAPVAAGGGPVAPIPPAAAGGVGAPNVGSTQRTWEITKADLATLLDLSTRLNLDGEITPVMAWGMILAHPRLGELRAEDFMKLADELKGKVRCYGFGAVMEEFEVRDALESVFSTKMDIGMSAGIGMAGIGGMGYPVGYGVKMELGY